MPEAPDNTCFQELKPDEIKLRQHDDAGETGAEIGVESGCSSSTDSGQNEGLSSIHKPENEKKPLVPETPQINEFRKKPYSGLSRHRSIVFACLILAAGVLAASSINLKELISKEVDIDTNFKMINHQPEPELPANLNFVRNNEYDAPDPNFDGNELHKVIESTWDSEKVGFVDKTGRIAIKPRFSGASNFKYGLAAVRPYFRPKDDKASSPVDPPPWGYINRSGKYVIKPQFEQAGDFDENGLAAVRLKVESGADGLCALINKKGEIIYKAKLSNPPTKMGNVYKVQEAYGKTGVIDKNGQWVLAAEYDGINTMDSNYNYSYYNNIFHEPRSAENSYFVIAKNGLCGIMDPNGKIVMPPLFSQINSFENGRAIFFKGDKFGMADSSGKILLDAKYDLLTTPAEIMAGKIKGKWVVMDSEGKELPVKIDAPLYEQRNIWLKDGRAPVLIGDKVGYIDQTGKLVIPAKFDMASVFSKGYAVAWDGQYWRFIDKSGKFVSDLHLAKPALFNNDGVASTTIAGPLYSLIRSKTISESENTIDSFKEATGVKEPKGGWRYRHAFR